MKAWDPQRNRLPDNRLKLYILLDERNGFLKIEILLMYREFIKNVYVDKICSLEKSFDRPPRDPHVMLLDQKGL